MRPLHALTALNPFRWAHCTHWPHPTRLDGSIIRIDRIQRACLDHLLAHTNLWNGLTLTPTLTAHTHSSHTPCHPCIRRSSSPTSSASHGATPGLKHRLSVAAPTHSSHTLFRHKPAEQPLPRRPGLADEGPSGSPCSSPCSDAALDAIAHTRSSRRSCGSPSRCLVSKATTLRSGTKFSVMSRCFRLVQLRAAVTTASAPCAFMQLWKISSCSSDAASRIPLASAVAPASPTLFPTRLTEERAGKQPSVLARAVLPSSPIALLKRASVLRLERQARPAASPRIPSALSAFWFRSRCVSVCACRSPLPSASPPFSPMLLSFRSRIWREGGSEERSGARWAQASSSRALRARERCVSAREPNPAHRALQPSLCIAFPASCSTRSRCSLARALPRHTLPSTRRSALTNRSAERFVNCRRPSPKASAPSGRSGV
mmetsp:Transcript_14589/g.29186  ORF Transcript_14589/g.29186 Transcript_14589/m.29186 type:complete len:431 (+) Transcript_14589:130-1422(+)